MGSGLEISAKIVAKLVLTQEDIASLWNGGTLAVKIDAPDTKVSVDVSCSHSSDGKRQSVRTGPFSFRLSARPTLGARASRPLRKRPRWPRSQENLTRSLLRPDN